MFKLKIRGLYGGRCYAKIALFRSTKKSVNYRQGHPGPLCLVQGGRVVREWHVWPVLPSRVGTPFLILGVLPQGSITPFLSLFCLKNGIFWLSRGKKHFTGYYPIPQKKKIPDFSKMPSDALPFWNSKRFFWLPLPFLGKNHDGVPPFSPISRYYPGVVSYTFTARPEGGYPSPLKRCTFDFGHTCRSRTTLPCVMYENNHSKGEIMYEKGHSNYGRSRTWRHIRGWP